MRIFERVSNHLHFPTDIFYFISLLKRMKQRGTSCCDRKSNINDISEVLGDGMWLSNRCNTRNLTFLSPFFSNERKGAQQMATSISILGGDLSLTSCSKDVSVPYVANTHTDISYFYACTGLRRKDSLATTFSVNPCFSSRCFFYFILLLRFI